MAQKIKKDLKDRCCIVLNHFSVASKTTASQSKFVENDGGCVTCSSLNYDNDWVANMDAANVEVASIRCINQYPIK